MNKTCPSQIINPYQPSFCYPKPSLKGYKKKKYPQNGLDSSQLMHVRQTDVKRNLRTYYNKTNLGFYQNGLDLMNITANYNFNRWNGYAWVRNKNSLRPARSTPWTFYPCEDCSILPGLKYWEASCQSKPWIPCPSVTKKIPPNFSWGCTRCCGPTEPIPKCPSSSYLSSEKNNGDSYWTK